MRTCPGMREGTEATGAAFTYLLTHSDGAQEHSPKCHETTVFAGSHERDVEHQRCAGITDAHGIGSFVSLRAFVQYLHTIRLIAVRSSASKTKQHTWATTGDGNWATVISSTASVSGSHWCMMCFSSDRPVSDCLTPSESTTPIASAMLKALSCPVLLLISWFITACCMLFKGSNTRTTNARYQQANQHNKQQQIMQHTFDPVPLSTPPLLLTLSDSIHSHWP